MTNLRINAQGIFWEDGQGAACLVDFQNYLANKSGLTIQHMPDRSIPSLPQLFLSFFQDIKQRFPENDLLALSYMLTVALAIPKLSSRSRPMQVLELGCGQGILSFYLAQLMGAMNPDSTLCCVSDALEPDWEPLIAQVERPCKLSYLATDYDSISLSPDFFDLVIVNSSNLPGDARMILSQAVRLCRKDAQIICMAQNDPLYESIFQLYFSQRNCYALTPLCVVQSGELSECTWEFDVSSPMLPHVETLLSQISALLSLSAPLTHAQCHKLCHEIEDAVHLAATSFQPHWKHQLLLIREWLISYTLAPDDAVQRIARKNLICHLEELKQLL